MIVVANRFEIADGYETEFVERFRENLGAVTEFDGFVSFELLVPGDDDTDSFVALTRWESRADFEAWTDSEAFERSHAGDAPREMFDGHPTLEIHEVAHSER